MSICNVEVIGLLQLFLFVIVSSHLTKECLSTLATAASQHQFKMVCVKILFILIFYLYSTPGIEIRKNRIAG